MDGYYRHGLQIRASGGLQIRASGGKPPYQAAFYGISSGLATVIFVEFGALYGKKDNKKAEDSDNNKKQEAEIKNADSNTDINKNNPLFHPNDNNTKKNEITTWPISN